MPRIKIRHIEPATVAATITHSSTNARVSFITASVTNLTQNIFLFRNQTVLSDISFSVTCTSLRLTTLKRNFKLKLLLRWRAVAAGPLALAE
jgi:ABC-type sulfate/molybdate transport systems ATPase subunit